MRQAIVVLLLIVFIGMVWLAVSDEQDVYVFEETENNIAHTGGGSYYVSYCCGSMEPTISIGDKVLLKEVEGMPLYVGDIVVYVRPNNRSKTSSHRIVGECDGGFIVKGDNNLYPDRFNSSVYCVPKIDIKWKVIGVMFE